MIQSFTYGAIDQTNYYVGLDFVQNFSGVVEVIVVPPLVLGLASLFDKTQNYVSLFRKQLSFTSMRD